MCLCLLLSCCFPLNLFRSINKREAAEAAEAMRYTAEDAGLHSLINTTLAEMVRPPLSGGRDATEDPPPVYSESSAPPMAQHEPMQRSARASAREPARATRGARRR